jgi:uncharacterized damage-inducible protein DinB
MQSEEAVFLRTYLVRQIQHEHETTRRILSAVPEQHREYRPHATARSAMELAWHLAGSEIWFLEGIIEGEFGTEQERMPRHIRTVADIIACYDRNVPALIEGVGKLTPEQLMRGVSLFGMKIRPAVTYLSTLLVHTTHHRGQLSAYIRAVGAPVPSIYGGSADEPFAVPAR